ncbi:VapA/VapB family virulence-associated protein [Streptomyces sp. NPDC054841]
MTEQKTQRAVSPDIIANDFATSMHGIMEQPEIDAAVEALRSLATRYPATGKVASAIFYTRWGVTVKNGKTFTGNAGGIGSAGGGALFGDIYTDDIDALYRDTVSFQYNATALYVNVNFFNKSHKLLGHFEAGAVSTVLGTGGGKGSWA